MRWAGSTPATASTAGGKDGAQYFAQVLGMPRGPARRQWAPGACQLALDDAVWVRVHDGRELLSATHADQHGTTGEDAGVGAEDTPARSPDSRGRSTSSSLRGKPALVPAEFKRHLSRHGKLLALTISAKEPMGASTKRGGEPRTRRSAPGPMAPAHERPSGPALRRSTISGEISRWGCGCAHRPPTPRRAVSRARRPSSPKSCRTEARGGVKQVDSAMPSKPTSRCLPGSSGRTRAGRAAGRAPGHRRRRRPPGRLAVRRSAIPPGS